ncbi:MAG: L-histidine N(alpha)-methyltransferase [Candidatus Eremiobacteraeota bacterium]|nr:L-histidine N(alpha)-methyltransferase [Candidatus Eremiobacteraeota bacterium]
MNVADFGDRYRERIWETHIAEDFERDVLAGLSAVQKTIPSKYLYDALGSALFEAIVLLPEYDLPRRESALLERYAPHIIDRSTRRLRLLELGSGSSQKTRTLIEAAIERYGSVEYTAVDISLDAVRNAAVQLLDRYPEVTVRALVGDYFQVLGEVAPQPATLALFLGSNLGNYPGERGVAFLRAVRGALAPSDMLLLGVDLRKDRALMERAYNDDIGVTAAFSKNVLARINRDLGAEIDIGNFKHSSVFDERTGSVESYLIAACVASYSLGRGRGTVSFAAGERIHIESSHKFTHNELRVLADECGFVERGFFTDEDAAFALVLLERGEEAAKISGL